MAYSISTAAFYDARFEEAVLWRIENAGRVSARCLVEAQEHVESLVSDNPNMGAQLDKNGEVGNKGLRWVLVDTLVAVYEVFPESESLVFEELFHPRENWR